MTYNTINNDVTMAECLKGEPPFSRGQIEFQIDNDIPETLPGGPPRCRVIRHGSEADCWRCADRFH